jgi:hypothetical protein
VAGRLAPALTLLAAPEKKRWYMGPRKRTYEWVFRRGHATVVVGANYVVLVADARLASTPFRRCH